MSRKIINFYELNEVQELTPKYHNPNYDKDTMPLKHPLRLIVLGASGSGKTVITLNIINLMTDTFKCIIIFTQNKNEPLYEFLEKKIPYPAFQIYEGINEVHKFNFNDLEEEQTLIIFDDMCVESDKKQQPISQIFINGRKLCGMKGISLIYLSQQYFKIPKTIRGQATGMIIRKINGKQDTNMVMRDCSGNVKKNQMMNMYKYCCDPHDVTQFLFIDYTAYDEDRFRKNFDEILNPDDFDF